jgi:hypothetical protein
MLTSDRETTETPPLLERLGLCDSGGRRNDNGVEDKAVLKALDLAHHLGLVILRAVVVNHTKATEQGNVDSHVVFGDRVHGRRDKGCLESDALRDGSIEVDVDGGEAYCMIVRRTLLLHFLPDC